MSATKSNPITQSFELPGLLSSGKATDLDRFLSILETRNLAERVVRKLGPEKVLGKSGDIESAVKFLKRGAFTVELEAPKLILKLRLNNRQYGSEILSAYLEEFSLYLQEQATVAARRNLDFIRKRLQEAENSLQVFTEQSTNLKFLKRDLEIEVQTKVLALLREQLELAEIDAKKQEESFQVIEPPYAPNAPSGPYYPFIVVAAFFSAVILVILYEVTRFILKNS